MNGPKLVAFLTSAVNKVEIVKLRESYLWLARTEGMDNKKETTVMENQMDKTIEHEMQNGVR